MDDDPDVIRLAQRALAQGGYLVDETTSGLRAMHSIEQNPPDLIVLDLVMPKPDGMDILKALRARPQTASVPVLVLTALDDEQSVQACFEIGATDYLTKPFSIPQFAARVRACLMRARVA